MKRIRRLLNPLDVPRMTLSPAASAVILTVVAALVATAWQPNSPSPATPYERWLKEDVAYIVLDRERKAFSSLKTDEERDRFIEQFWERRNPTPGSGDNPFKQEHYRRIAYVNEHYAGSVPGWKTDRGMLYIKYGPPDEIESHPGGGNGKAYPYEQWLYRYIEGMGENVIFEFDDVNSTGDFPLVNK